ncbi:MAG: hypothetical protein KJ725_14420 [Gammaproteobacteria bacterium]|nr:hypothetical protein [Gammaproteobacteria bacterium]
MNKKYYILKESRTGLMNGTYSCSTDEAKSILKKNKSEYPNGAWFLIEVDQKFQIPNSLFFPNVLVQFSDRAFNNWLKTGDKPKLERLPQQKTR